MKLHSSASYSYLISLVFLKTGFPSFSSPISKRSEYSSLFLWSTWKSAHLSAFTRFFAYIYRQKTKLELTVMSWIISSHLPDKNHTSLYDKSFEKLSNKEICLKKQSFRMQFKSKNLEFNIFSVNFSVLLKKCRIIFKDLKVSKKKTGFPI